MTFARLLSEAHAASQLPGTGDVLAVGLPLLRQLADLHSDGMVSRLDGVAHYRYLNGELGVDPHMVQRPSPPSADIERINATPTRSGVAISGSAAADFGTGGRVKRSNLDVLLDTGDAVTTAPNRPMTVIGYRAWEQLHRHHDRLTDIHLAGLALCSYATALDLDVPSDISELADHRRHLLRLNPALHPVVAGVLSEMIEPDRRRRPGDLRTVIARLEHHRDLTGDLDLDGAYAKAANGPRTWETEVLRTLRDRVFDLSRRNRAIYFRPTASSVGLTEASVPMLLDVTRITPDDLLTWSPDTAGRFASGRPVNLGRWCRFEEATHVPPALDKIITSERRNRAEYGFGRLKLIVAFLRWIDPETNEVVNSPLVMLQARLARKKGVTTLYQLTCEGDALVNPDLRHLLNVRFGLVLPDSVDPEPDSIRSLVEDLERQVRQTEPAMRIEVIDQPRIQLLRKRAQLRLDAFRRRRARSLANTGSWRRVNHSYDGTDFRPLGLELYRRFLKREELPLRDLAGAAPLPTMPQHLAAPSSAREIETYSVQQSDVNRHRWEVDLCAVTLAQIGSKRSSLVRDYDALLDNESLAARHAPFHRVFAPDARAIGAGPVSDGIGLDQTLVLPADDAQATAVRRASAGESFIIQGPPGTGKSQTITNLIAAMVAAGKRVLFVCEKRAALDVVSNRLNQVGLGDLTATIHDSQADRKSFIAERGEVYSEWLDGADTPSTAPARQRDLRAQAERELARLSALATDLDVGGLGGRSLIERAIRFRLAGTPPAQLAVTPDQSNIEASLPRLRATAESLTALGRSGYLGDEPCLRFRPGTASTVADLVTASRRIGDACGALETAGLELTAVPVGSLTEVAVDAEALLAFPHAIPLLADGIDAASLEVDRTELERLDRAVAAATPDIANWTRPLMGPADARAAYEIANQREGSFFKFLNKQWREVKAAVESAYNFDAHQIRPATAAVTAALVTFHDAEAARTAFAEQLIERWGTANLEQLRTTLDQVRGGVLARTAQPGFDPASVAAAARELADVLQPVLPSPGESTAELNQWAEQAKQTLPSLQAPLDRWNELDGATDATLTAARTPGTALISVEAGVAEQGMAQLQERLQSAGVSGPVIDAAIEQLLQLHSRLLEANAEAVRDSVRQKFIANAVRSTESRAGKSAEEKQWMSAYRAGRKVLENEFGKKMRHKPIRELASGDPGRVVSDLTPIWLMSPLSVTDTLPLDGDLFDCVVFDEASQIPVEDAVPTIFRAPQVIVVGDRMQLPPTNFFSVAADGEDDDDADVLVDDDGHRLILSLDADSFLNQADLALPSALLNWHYRSRSESLIAYSNTAFYESRLATIPDLELPPVGRRPIRVAADDTGTVGPVTDRPISFHGIEGSVYTERRNVAEADYIAQLVRERLRSGDGLTIGVVAFSEAQQTEIENSLQALASDDTDFATALAEEQERTDGDEFVGLFVKNLENVQGDERDIIIMSVCYGPDGNDRMRMNFGPINQAGGERRLNVIFSRAKRHMAIVSSIDGSDITNLHNPGAAHLSYFLTYAAAESEGAVDAGAAALARVPGAVPPEDAVETTSVLAEQVAAGLRQRGLVVDERVGRSGFRVDLAVRGEDAYVLGVLIEPGLPAATAGVARYVAEAGVLKAFDWPIVRLSVTDWLAEPEAVLDRLQYRIGTL